VVEDQDFSDEDSLLGQSILDSTGILELVSFVEEAFEIKVEDDEVIPDNLDSVRKVLDFVSRKTGQSLESR
jgi:acyl carrier protein